MPDPESLRAMRDQVDAAHLSAERLVREAEAAARARADEAPPLGWAGPEEPPPEPGAAEDALRAVLSLLELVRASVPAELTEQLAATLRDLLTSVRALIDLALERLEATLAAAEPT